ncbi:hypothetical protein [Streptomyces sp. NBC_00046]|uniref:hypothetical protein n=1 Tax=unclassified Streptomyces TaxID=2593676 RepID=UPI0032494676
MFGGDLVEELVDGHGSCTFAAVTGTTSRRPMVVATMLRSGSELVARCALEPAVLRALLRRDGRWWTVAGTE